VLKTISGASKINFLLYKDFDALFKLFFFGAIRELLKCDEDILKCVKTFIPVYTHLAKYKDTMQFEGYTALNDFEQIAHQKGCFN
jgi:hypothetical protein